MSNGHKLLFSAAAFAALMAAIVFINDEPPPQVAVSDLATQSAANVPSVARTPSDIGTPPQAGAETSGAAVTESSGDGDAFRVDAKGELVLDEQTRLFIEALVAQTESRELYTAVREQTEHLPLAAAKRAEELVDKFVQYQQAQRQTYPPDDAPRTPEEAISLLEGLHALREAHLGPEVARLFYGNEEVIAREMVEVMRLENDQSLTPEERAERARALRERLPGIATIEKKNRDSDAARQQERN